jgi:hypothetical protein
LCQTIIINAFWATAGNFLNYTCACRIIAVNLIVLAPFLSCIATQDRARRQEAQLRSELDGGEALATGGSDPAAAQVALAGVSEQLEELNTLHSLIGSKVDDLLAKLRAAVGALAAVRFADPTIGAIGAMGAPSTGSTGISSSSSPLSSPSPSPSPDTDLDDMALLPDLRRRASSELEPTSAPPSGPTHLNFADLLGPGEEDDVDPIDPALDGGTGSGFGAGIGTGTGTGAGGALGLPGGLASGTEQIVVATKVALTVDDAPTPTHHAYAEVFVLCFSSFFCLDVAACGKCSPILFLLLPLVLLLLLLCLL